MKARTLPRNVARVLAVVAAISREGVPTAACVVVDAGDGRTLAESVCTLTREEAERFPRPEEWAMRGAFAALPAVARGIVDVFVVAAEADAAGRIGADVRVPTVAAGKGGIVGAWGAEEEHVAAAAGAERFLLRARGLLT